MTGKWNCLLTPCMTWNLVLPILVYASNEGKRKDRHASKKRGLYSFSYARCCFAPVMITSVGEEWSVFFVLVLINNNNYNDKMLFIALYLKLINPRPSFIMITLNPLSINGEATNTISTDPAYLILDCLRCWIDCHNGFFFLITWRGFPTKMYTDPFRVP